MVNPILYQICHDNDIDLIGSNINCYDPVDNTIRYCIRLKGDNLTYTILHEVGHAIQFLSGKFNEHYRFTESKEIPSKHKDLYIYYTISCEYDAWERGKLIADKYKLSVDSTRYYKYAAKFTKQYISTLLTIKLEV
jgi:hypothetical protein